MKKVICAVAAFAMVAGVATIASAEVSLSGDARARIVFNNGFLDGVGGNTYYDSRMRIKIKATTEGGGYAIGRLRLLDGKWGQGADYTPLAKGGGNVWSDYAYLGFKKGLFDVAAGKMPIGFSPWFVDDERADRFRVKFVDGGLLLAFTYDKKIYDANVLDNDQDDKDIWGLTYTQKFNDDFKLGARAVYVMDSTPADRSGVKFSINADMSFAGNNIFVEGSYKEGDTAILGSDDQYGGYVEWNATYGSITPVARVGFTQNNFSADETFGWIMIGGDEPISKISRVGLGGDTIFVGLSSKYQMDEDLNFQANLVYMNVNANGPLDMPMYGENPFEISGQTKYTISKGVNLVGKIGYLINDSDWDDMGNPFSAYGKMEVEF